MCTTGRLGRAHDPARAAAEPQPLTSACGPLEEASGSGAPLSDLLRAPAPPPQRIPLAPGCWLEWWPWLPWRDRDALLAELRDELPLAGETLRIHGREVAVPRLLSYHGDPGTAYRYSGRIHEPRAWSPRLAALRRVVIDLSGVPLNAVLANYYRDGRDAMGYHADDEPGLGPERRDVAIASLSLGAERRFLLKERGSGALQRFDLGHGSLLVMRGRTQERYRHALPRTRRPVAPRLNLTFRVVAPGATRGAAR